MFYKVVLVGGSPWGFRLEDSSGNDRVKIAKINTNSKAQCEGIQIGDIIHSVNGNSVHGMTSSEVMQIVRNTGNTLSLELLRDDNSAISSNKDDTLSSGISSYTSSSSFSTMSADRMNDSLTFSHSISPLSDQTNRPSTAFSEAFGRKTTKSYKPVSFDVRGSDISSTNVDADSNTNSKNQRSSTFISDHADPGHSSASSAKLTDIESDTNLINSNTDRSWKTFGSHSAQASSDSDSLTNFSGSFALSDSRPASKSQSFLPAVQNPTITLLQKKRAEAQVTQMSASTDNIFPNGITESNKSYIDRSTSDMNLSKARYQSGEYQPKSQKKLWNRSYNWEEDEFNANKLNQRNEIETVGSTTGTQTLTNSKAADEYHSGKAYHKQDSGVQNVAGQSWNQSDNEPVISKKFGVQTNLENNYTSAGDFETDSITSEKRPVKFEGIGPVDETTGVPIATRSSLDQKNQKDWYKHMYKSLHKSDRDSESLYVFAGEDRGPYHSDRTRRKSTHEVTYTIRKANPEGKAADERYASSPSLADTDTKSSNETISKTKGATRKSQSSAPLSPQMKKNSSSWIPPAYRYENQPYKVQPRSIEDYEPGKSSVLLRESNLFSSSVGHLNNEEERRQSNRRLNKRPFWKSTESVAPGRKEPVQKGRKEPVDTTKHLNGSQNGLLPRTSAASSTTSNNKVSNNWVKQNSGREQTSSVFKNESERHRYDRSNSASGPTDRRKQEQLTQRVQYPIKLQNASRKEDPHANDTQHESSFVRSDGNPIISARATYTFRAQSPTDLSFHEGDMVYIFRHIDSNWCEGESNGVVGKFPIKFVEVQDSLDADSSPEMQNFGKGRAIYDFVAQTVLELSFKKGEEVFLVSRINEDWFEGRIGSHAGFVPANFFEIVKEPISSPKEENMKSSNFSSTAAPPPLNTSIGQSSGLNNGSKTSVEASSSYRKSGNSNSDGQKTGYVNKGLSSQVWSNSSDTRSFPTRSSAQASLSKSIGLRSTSVKPSSELAHSGSNREDGLYYQAEPKVPPFGAGSGNAGGRSQASVQTATVGPTYKTSQVANGNPVEPGERTTRYHALFTYKPTRADELELSKGDVVYVMEKYDDGWYIGMSERTKKLGTFPGNYVEAL